MKGRIRARTDAAKEEKRKLILETALKLFETTPYERITMEAVASGAGVAKGTLFVYFATREELFLAVAEALFARFFETLRSGLATSPPVNRVTLRGWILGAIRDQASWLAMIPLLDVIIERNVSQESLIRFKGYLLAEMTGIGAAMGELCPFLDRVGGGARFLFWLYGIMAGFLHLADPGVAARQAIESGGMEPFRFDFYEEFDRFLTLFLEGLDREG